MKDYQSDVRAGVGVAAMARTLGGGMVVSDVMVKQSTQAGVPSAMGGLEAAIQDLAKMIAVVEGRLESAGVLHLGPPRASGPDHPTPPNFQSSLANVIDQQRKRVQVILQELQELQERIDL